MRDSVTQRLLGLVCGQSYRASNKMANNIVVILDDSDVPCASLNKDPEKCIVEELRRWLECHGVEKIGKKTY